MFRFGGNALEPFEAEYIHEFQLERMEQTGRTYNDRMEMHFRPLPFSNVRSPLGLYTYPYQGLTRFPFSGRLVENSTGSLCSGILVHSCSLSVLVSCSYNAKS